MIAPPPPEPPKLPREIVHDWEAQRRRVARTAGRLVWIAGLGLAALAAAALAWLLGGA